MKRGEKDVAKLTSVGWKKGYVGIIEKKKSHGEKGGEGPSTKRKIAMKEKKTRKKGRSVAKG